MIGYELVLVWAVWMAACALAGRLVRWLRGPCPSGRDDDLDGQTRSVTRWMGRIGFVLLVLHPLLFQVGWWAASRNPPDWWTVITFYPEPGSGTKASASAEARLPTTGSVETRLDRGQLNENKRFHDYDLVVRLTIGCFALASFVLLTSSDVRGALLPVMELALDVLNYLPPRRFIDAWAVPRFLLGGRRSSWRPSLDDVLRARLRALIELAWRRHGRPVRVVAHSLGSIIALSALSDWHGPGAVVDLTTIGSPLMLLAKRLPREYGATRPDGGHRAMPAVIRWRNYYFDQDLVGRRLDPQLAAPATTPPAFDPGRSLGDGTHTEYFGDSRFAPVLSG